jgi:RNA polymerase sigma-70 factor (ECF subfamily)
MPGNRKKDRTDFVLLANTRDYFIESTKGKVVDPKLLLAWRRFHQLYHPVIKRIAMSCGIRGSLLDDVMQIAWENVIRDLRDFECDPSKGSFRSWLFTRVRNASVDQVRNARRRREHCAGINYVDDLAAELVEPDQIFERQWDEVVLHDALKLLERCVSELDYKLFVMRRFHELSIAELADDTGLCESTIRSKLHRTLKTFVNIFEERGYRDLLFRRDG